MELIQPIILLAFTALTGLSLAVTVSTLKRFFTGKRKVGVNVPLGKPLAYIPPVAEINPETGLPNKQFKELNLKYKQVSEFPDVTEKTFTPPTDDAGESIPAHTLAYLSWKNILTDRTINETIHTMFYELVNKKALTLMYSQTGSMGFEVNEKHDWLNPLEKELLATIKKVTRGRTPLISKRLIGSIRKAGFEDTVVNMIVESGYQVPTQTKKSGNVAEIIISGVGIVTAGFITQSVGDTAFAMLVAPILASIMVVSGGINIFLGAYMNTSNYKGKAGGPLTTLKGTGTLARAKAYRNYLTTTHPNAQYSLEKSDLYGELLPWAVAYGETDQWVNVFAQPLNDTGEKIVLNGNIYDADKFKLALKSANLKGRNEDDLKTLQKWDGLFRAKIMKDESPSNRSRRKKLPNGLVKTLG